MNRAHFSGALPPMPIRWEPRLEEVGVLAGRTFSLRGMFGRVGDRQIILIHPVLRDDPRGLERALAHEMVHAYLTVTGDEGPEHGPAFQMVLARLANEGAFTAIAATPEEREGLRIWLDAESARLEAERQAMERDALELDRQRADAERAIDDTARREAYNDRAIRANERADRYRAARAELTRQVERYNLMLAYPDGISGDAGS